MFQLNHGLICYFSPFFFVLLCFFNKPSCFLLASPGTTGTWFPLSFCSGLSPNTRGLPWQMSVCVFFYFHCFLKKRVKEHAGALGSSPALPSGFSDASSAVLGLPSTHCSVSCFPAWVSSARCPLIGSVWMHLCWSSAEKLLGLPHTKGRDGCIRRMLQLLLLPKGLCTLC